MKRVEVVESLEGLLRYSVVPNFRVLGPRLGALMPKVKAALAEADGATVRDALESTGVYEVTLGGETIRLGPDDLEVRAEEHEEFALAQEGPHAVALDLAVDDELRLEGLAREIMRALNDHRKAIGLAISDRIRVSVHAKGLLGEAVARHGDWIAGEVLAVEWSAHPTAEPTGWDHLDVEGEPVAVRLERANVDA